MHDASGVDKALLVVRIRNREWAALIYEKPFSSFYYLYGGTFHYLFYFILFFTYRLKIFYTELKVFFIYDILVYIHLKLK